jgi:hypothetical protein
MRKAVREEDHMIREVHLLIDTQEIEIIMRRARKRRNTLNLKCFYIKILLRKELLWNLI